MSYLGKVYKHVKDENYDAFTKSLNLPGDRGEQMVNFKPSLKLDKNGDKYTLHIIHAAGSKGLEFECGVEFPDKHLDALTFSTIITVEGNTITQVQKVDDVIMKNVKEYSGDQLVETITSNFWDGTARRYFSAE